MHNEWAINTKIGLPGCSQMENCVMFIIGISQMTMPVWKYVILYSSTAVIHADFFSD
jgi:hypothetical protein